MKNFERELSKSIKRLNLGQSRISRNLCPDLLEDKFNLEPSLDDCVHIENGHIFSLSFVETLLTSDELDKYYIVDGIKYWFKHLKVASRASLVRCPSLLVALYNLQIEVYKGKILIDNPWIISEFSYSNGRIGSNLYSSVNKTLLEIKELCETSLSNEFMPKGIWGIDILFKYRFNTNPPPEVLTFGDIHLVPANEFIKEAISCFVEH